MSKLGAGLTASGCAAGPRVGRAGVLPEKAAPSLRGGTLSSRPAIRFLQKAAIANGVCQFPQEGN